MLYTTKNLKLDSRKRITLGKYIDGKVKSYDMDLKSDGVIILYPHIDEPPKKPEKDGRYYVLEGYTKELTW